MHQKKEFNFFKREDVTWQREDLADCQIKYQRVTWSLENEALNVLRKSWDAKVYNLVKNCDMWGSYDLISTQWFLTF